MRTPITLKIALLSLALTSVALAAPAAIPSESMKCTHHCVHENVQSTAAIRGALYGTQARHCNHGAMTVARWGQPQSHCPKCVHSA
jgi:hypothetical protein